MSLLPYVLALAGSTALPPKPAVLSICATYDTSIVLQERKFFANQAHPITPPDRISHDNNGSTVLHYNRRQVPTSTTRRDVERALEITDSVFRANANIGFSWTIEPTRNLTPPTALTDEVYDSVQNDLLNRRVLGYIRGQCKADITIHFAGLPRNVPVGDIMKFFSPRNINGLSLLGHGSAIVYTDLLTARADWQTGLKNAFNEQKPFQATRANKELLARSRAEITIHEIGHLLGLPHEENPVRIVSPAFRTGKGREQYGFMYKRHPPSRATVGWSSSMNRLRNMTGRQLRHLLYAPR